MDLKWTIPLIDEALVSRLSFELNINPITSRILINRGIRTPEEARKYFEPKLSDIPDPLTIPGMEEGARRIAAAVAKKEKIAIFGDYDADGVTATALFAQFLKSTGIEPVLRLPNRQREGYGISLKDLDELRGAGATLILTVDNGSNAVDEVEYASKLGMDVVVVDHHTVGSKKPRAVSIINPRCSVDAGVWHDLSACGVAFMLAAAVRRSLRKESLLPQPEPNLKKYLDLVAIGTIGDVMPVTGINRIFVSFGLEQISKTENPGMSALMDVSGTDAARVSAYSVAFQLAPRINAAGRLADAGKALELFMCGDILSAVQIAKELNMANRERQKIEEAILEEAIRQAETKTLPRYKNSIVVASGDWHVGVVGIVAAKLVQRFSLPTVVISGGSSPARGSGRSPTGINLVDALSQCGRHLVRYGGHSLAAGISIDLSNLDGFSRDFDDACGTLARGLVREGIKVDSRVNAADITPVLVGEINRCQPFGVGNPEPVIAIDNVDVIERRIVGDNHLKLKIRSDDYCFDVIGFGLASDLPPDVKKVSLAFVPEFNTWNGVTKVQLRAKKICPVCHPRMP